MTLEQAKKELVKRYRYLYENAYFILAPFIREQTKKEFKECAKKYGKNNLKSPLIYLNIKRLDNLNALFEEFLLSDKNMEESSLYQMVESKRDDKEYLAKVREGLSLVEKKNKNRKNLKESLDIWVILSKVSGYIDEQSADLKNKERKLYVIDQYYRILRYKNNGKIYTSGRKLNLHDCSSVVILFPKKVPSRDKNDIGITKNAFITAIENAPCYKDNLSIFTEHEKQLIYLDYHDELPYDLEIICYLEAEYFETMIESRLYRPENTAPCGENFKVKEEEIFMNPNASLYNKYYQLCPHCGYIVNIPGVILSDGIKKRIEERCRKDDKLFRKMFLYSELISLENASIEGQRRLLTKE